MIGRFNNNIKYKSQFDYFSYMSFRYHHLFFHSLIFKGNKLWAFNFFILIKYELKKREMVDPFWVFLVSIMKITPEFILLPLKLGGTTQFVPLPISEKKQYTFAIKFVIKLIRDRFRKLSVSSICDALVLSIYNKGISIEKKTSLYQTALSIDICLDFSNSL